MLKLSESIQSETTVTIEKVCARQNNGHLCLLLFVERIAFSAFVLKFINIYYIVEKRQV